MSLLQNLPQNKYDFKLWNCYTLAQWIRNYYGLTPLPDFNWAVTKFCNENDKPIDFLENNLKNYAIKNNNDIENYDLILLNFNGETILSTYVEGYVYLMSATGAICLPIYRLSTYIISIWSYKK